MVPPEKLKCVSFPPEAKAVLNDLFTRYPPCDGDTTGTSLGIYTGNIRSNWKDDFFQKPQLTKHDIKNNVASLSSRLENDKRFRQVSCLCIFTRLKYLSIHVSESTNHAVLGKRNTPVFE